MSLSLTVLGSSGALPALGRFTSAQYLIIQDTHMLIDCGEGTQMQLASFQISAHKIDHIFISHLHGDHYLGLAPLLFSMHLNRRERDLHLYSPKGLDEILTLQLKYSRSVLNYKIVFHPVSTSEKMTLLDHERFTVASIPLLHKIECAGFLFKEKPKPRKINKEKLAEISLQQIASLKSGKDLVDESGHVIHRNEEFTLPPRPSHSFAYCSDTAWNPSMIEQIRDVDLLYHEATFLSSDGNKADETMHSTARQAAQIASLAQVKKLLIGHFSARYKDLSLLLDEARGQFVNTELAQEGIQFIVED